MTAFIPQAKIAGSRSAKTCLRLPDSDFLLRTYSVHTYILETNTIDSAHLDPARS
jgi:hypothetical protein